MSHYRMFTKNQIKEIATNVATEEIEKSNVNPIDVILSPQDKDFGNGGNQLPLESTEVNEETALKYKQHIYEMLKRGYATYLNWFMRLTICSYDDDLDMVWAKFGLSSGGDRGGEVTIELDKNQENNNYYYTIEFIEI